MKCGKSGCLNRDVTRSECGWLDKDYSKGTPVSECKDETYGCIASGIACYIQNKTFFDELPYDAISWANT